MLRTLLSILPAVAVASAAADPVRVDLVNGLVAVTIPDKWERVEFPGLTDFKIRPEGNDDQLGSPECNIRASPVTYLSPGQRFANEITSMRKAEDLLPANIAVSDFSNATLIDGVQVIRLSFRGPAGRGGAMRQFIVASGKNHVLVHVDCIEGLGDQRTARHDNDSEAFLNSIRINPR